MGLPVKEYYYLPEVLTRWKVAGIDLRYFAEHGHLEVQTWLNEAFIKIFRNKKLQDGLDAQVHVDTIIFTGYAIVAPIELRKIFCSSPQPVVMFKHPTTGDTLKIHYKDAPPLIGVEDLVVCKAERDRFEALHQLEIDAGATATSVASSHSFGGRPSVMRLVEKEFERRCSNKTVENSLQKESDALEIWVAENIPGVQTPKSKAIMNAIRAKYRMHRNNLTITPTSETAQAKTT